MTFSLALEAARMGRAVRRNAWGHSYALTVRKEVISSGTGDIYDLWLGDAKGIALASKDLLAEDWEVIE